MSAEKYYKPNYIPIAVDQKGQEMAEVLFSPVQDGKTIQTIILIPPIPEHLPTFYRIPIIIVRSSTNGEASLNLHMRHVYLKTINEIKIESPIWQVGTPDENSPKISDITFDRDSVSINHGQDKSKTAVYTSENLTSFSNVIMKKSQGVWIAAGDSIHEWEKPEVTLNLAGQFLSIGTKIIREQLPEAV